MCPDCTRGLTYPKLEVCTTCGGTALLANKQIMNEETVVAPAGDENVEAPAVADEAIVEPAAEEVAPEVAA